MKLDIRKNQRGEASTDLRDLERRYRATSLVDEGFQVGRKFCWIKSSLLLRLRELRSLQGIIDGMSRAGRI